MLDDLAVVTPERLDALGVAIPRGLAEATIALYRSTSKSKFHWADQRSRCKHLPGNDRYWAPATRKRPAPPVTNRVPALGFSEPVGSVCLSCARAISVSPPADAFVAVAAELVRGRDWLEIGRGSGNDSWTWLQFARWKARQPLSGRGWDERLQPVRGKAWTEPGLALRAALSAYRDEANRVARQVADSIGDNPGISTLLERAVLMVETESAVLQESAAVLKISGCGVTQDAYTRMFMPTPARLTYRQSDPWQVVAGLWTHTQKKPSASSIDLGRAAADYLDDQFPHVHDLNAIPSCPVHEPPAETGDSVHTWAWRIAQAHRRGLVREWIARLDLAAAGLFDAHHDASDDCTHLICIPWWPLTSDGMDAIAYLSQFQVVCGPVAMEGPTYGPTTEVAVVRAPAWAAAHTAELRSPLRSEPITDEWPQAIRMLREQGVALVEGEFTARRKPSSLVEAAREERNKASSANQYWCEQRRPLRPGARPRDPHVETWSWGEVRMALESAHFVYGADDNDLLALGLPADGRSRMEAQLEVECQSFDGSEPYLCEIYGIVESVQPTGTVEFTPEGMRDSVTIPAAYVVCLAFR